MSSLRTVRDPLFKLRGSVFMAYEELTFDVFLFFFFSFPHVNPVVVFLLPNCVLMIGMVCTPQPTCAHHPPREPPTTGRPPDSSNKIPKRNETNQRCRPSRSPTKKPSRIS